jgi:predicted homoserine dehydrogenase-like protein
MIDPPPSAAAPRPVRAGLIGVGQFGRSLLARSLRMSALDLPVLCERRPERAQAAFIEAGGDPAAAAICTERAAALAALERGQTVVLPDAALMMDLPLDLVVEATGEPEAAATNAEAALAHGKHVAMVSKEADSVIGPLLAHKAEAAGLVCTPVDGDQPSLLIRLVEWARALGLKIVTAGKASEHDFVLDPVTATVTAGRQRVRARAMIALWRLRSDALAADLAARAAVVAALPQRTPPDFCELTIVANATGLRPDRPALHAPILRTIELAEAFRLQLQGGLLANSGALDLFHCMRRPDEVSFAGGVFVVVRCDDPPTWQMLAGKGIPVSSDGSHALLQHPSHLLGVEAPRSIIAAVRAGRASGGAPRPVCDLVARAAEALPAGTVLALGERHAIAGLDPLIHSAAPLGPGQPVPYYLAVGARLRVDLPAGAILTAEMVEPPAGAALWRLRAEQDRLFHGA